MHRRRDGLEGSLQAGTVVGGWGEGRVRPDLHKLQRRTATGWGRMGLPKANLVLESPAKKRDPARGVVKKHSKRYSQ